LSKIKGGFSYKHILLHPSLWSYTPPKMGVKIRFFISFSNLEQVKEMKLGGYFLLVKRLFINIFFSLPYCYKGMRLATPVQFFIRTF